LTGIITQGNKDINSWVESYTVQHSLDGKVWNPVLESATHSEKVTVLYEWLHFDLVLHKCGA
jgi:F5/8 type C domain.